MSLSNSFPALRPSLLLDFAGSETIDPRITFTRASTARYYDQNTVAKAEENLFLYSQVFTNAWWQKPVTVSVTDNAAVAPDGTTTAARLVYSVQFGCVMASVSLVSGLQYTVSFWALNEAGSNTYSVYNNTALTSIGTYTPTGSWVRYSFTFTATATGTTLITIAQDRNASGFGSQWIWGAQLEQRSAVTAYTATTTAPITRYQPQLMTAAANIARLDHDPITREARGLLIEESRSNLLTFTEDFSNAAWTKTGAAITANAVVAPDGTLTADRLVEDTSTGDHRAFQSGSFTAGLTYTVSVYAKQSGRTLLQIYHNAGGGLSVTFNLSNGTVSAATVGTGTVTDVGNGWYRCSATALVDATGAANVQLRLVNTGINTSYTGDGYSGIFLWGAQLEAGAFATSYIARLDATAASRAADAPGLLGTNFSSWFRADEGTVVCISSRYALLPPSGFSNVWAISNGTSNERLLQYNTGSDQTLSSIITDNNVTQGVVTPPGNVTVNSELKTAFAYKTDDFAMCLNGSAISADTSGTLPSVDRLYLGAGSEGGPQHWAGHIKKFAFYPRRLTNAQLQALTR